MYLVYAKMGDTVSIHHIVKNWQYGGYPPFTQNWQDSGYLQYFTLPGLFHVESMEWGVDSMEWGMDSMEWGMDSIPFPGGFHTFSRWIPYFFQMDSILLPYGIQVE